MKSTKDKLLKIATKMFALHGFDKTSTRDLAKAAKTNLCSISYYFGSKKELYQAVINNTFKTIALKYKDTLPYILGQDSSPVAKIETIICNLFDFLCSDNTISDYEANIIVNELTRPSKFYNDIYDNILGPLHQAVSTLVALELNLDKDSKQTIILAHSIFGQAVMFRLHREAFFKRMNVKKYSPEIILDIKDIIRRNCRAVLNSAKETLS